MIKILESLGTITNQRDIEAMLSAEFTRQQRHVIAMVSDAEDRAQGYREAALTWIVRASDIAPVAPPVLRTATTGDARRQIQDALSDLSSWRLPHTSRGLDDLSHLNREMDARRATFALRLAESLLGCVNA